MDKRAKKHCVILATTAKGSVHKVLRDLRGNRFMWAYFGEDVANAIAIERQIKNRGQRLKITKELQETAKELRQPYIDYIGKLSVENNSLGWWARSVSEKNPFISKTFLYTSYIKVALEYLKSSEKSQCYVFFIKNRALRKSMFENISSIKEYQAKEIGMPFLDTLDNIRAWLIMLLIKFWFVVESVNRMFLSKYFYKFNRLPRPYEHRNVNKSMTLIHAWVDRRSFGKDGKYKESYFGGLANHLRRKGEEIVIVPYVLGTVSYLSALQNMQKSGEKFLLPYAFLSIKDMLSVAFNIALAVPKKKEFPLFEGMEISNLIYDDFRRDWIGIRLARDLILYNFVKGWKKREIKINSFIHTYENNTWEKVFNIALQEFYPETKIIGYQHSAVPKMLLSYFYSSSESDIIPLPDRIITNGRYPERLFKESGYDSRKVVCGGAIRYASIFEESKMHIEDKVPCSSQKCTVLVATSITRNDAAELVRKTLKALEYSDKYDIIIKCHPGMPYSKFAKDLGIGDMPKNFRLSQRPTPELLKESNVLLYTSTTTCIEALNFGVTVIHVESDHIIDMDQLDFAPDVRISARSPEEIKRCLKEIESRDREKLLVERKMWKKIVKEVFEPVTAETYDLFLQ